MMVKGKSSLGKIIELKCPKCGAMASLETMKCEYCGTHVVLDTQILQKTPIEEIQELFPEDLVHLLSFEEMGKFIIVRFPPMKREDFMRICVVVRDAGGVYVSAGANSHFRIPRTKK